ncbi:MAG TPA: GntR family transcriptional regulator [Bacteroidales bacterium]|nr:GntR family transcriptional regulator [Bacteroidales bacterium]
MNFKASKGIFQQIADNICRQILEGKLPPGERIPSVRDLAEMYEVNRNTLLRTYAILENEGIAINKRGIGYFVADDAVELIHAYERKEFFAEDLPEFYQKVKLLKLTENDLSDLLKLIKENTHEKK